MSGHTPGPWKLDIFDGGINVDGERPIALMLGLAEEGLANARLIAAAPELLEALKRYVEHDDTAYDPAENFWRQIKDEALAAIAKAEGK